MKNEQGFSAVEALIAAAITLVILAGTMDSFNRSLTINEQASQMADVEQNMRAGMNLLVSDFLAAGWSIPVGGIPIPSGVGATSVKRPGPPGTNLTFDTTTISAVNAGPALGPMWNTKTTDIVNILYADNSLDLNDHNLVAIAPSGVSITVDPATPISGAGVENPIKRGDLILLSNANSSTLQCVTSVNGQIIYFSASDDMNLNQPSAADGSIAQLENADKTYPPTSAIRVWLVTYYLDYVNFPDSPRLIRRINWRDGQQVALVVEDLQLSYDLVDGGFNPINQKIPVAPNGPSQIRKANILLSGRTSNQIRRTGEYLRSNLTTQVSLRSLSYFDRY